MSGFFGSGKSSFAKNFGYALENRKVLGHSFGALFKNQLLDPGKKDTRIGDLLDLINAKIPTQAILFEVAKEADTRKVTQRIAELMYTVLLRELGYSEDFDIAELEIELEAEGKLSSKRNCSEPCKFAALKATVEAAIYLMLRLAMFSGRNSFP